MLWGGLEIEAIPVYSMSMPGQKRTVSTLDFRINPVEGLQEILVPDLPQTRHCGRLREVQRDQVESFDPSHRDTGVWG